MNLEEWIEITLTKISTQINIDIYFVLLKCFPKPLLISKVFLILWMLIPHFSYFNWAFKDNFLTDISVITKSFSFLHPKLASNVRLILKQSGDYFFINFTNTWCMLFLFTFIFLCLWEHVKLLVVDMDREAYKLRRNLLLWLQSILKCTVMVAWQHRPMCKDLKLLMY